MRRIPKIRFDPASVSEAVVSDLRESVWSLRSIPPERRQSIFEIAHEAITRGRDGKLLFDGLAAIGLDRDRATSVTWLLLNRATEMIGRERMLSAGIEFAIWAHSGAPCGVALPGSDAYDRVLDQEHRHANGQTYSIRQGALIAGRRTWPGRDEGCKCFAKAVLPK